MEVCVWGANAFLSLGLPKSRLILIQSYFFNSFW